MRKTTSALLVILLAAVAAAPGRAQPPAEAAEDLREARDALIRAADYAAALGPAEGSVAEAESAEDPRLPDDLMHLARVQAELGMFTQAELNYLRAVELVKEAGGEFSIDLLPPYQGLGRTYIRNRDFPAAITVLEQAQHVSQRNEGLYNVGQTPLIDDLTTALLGMGDTLEARERQEERLANAVRQFGAEDPRVIPFHYHLADYYERSRLRTSAREQYAEALGVAEKHYGPDDPRLLQPLRAIMQIDMSLGQDTTSARDRLSAILDANSGDARVAPEERSLSLAALGDWALAGGDTAAAEDYYARAYAALAGHDPAAAEQRFAAPAMLDFVPPLSAVDRGARSRPYAWGEIVLRFDLSAEGRASNVRTVSVTPEHRIESDYVRRLRETHFRPKLAAGRPVPITNVEFRHFFRYYADPEQD